MILLHKIKEHVVEVFVGSLFVLIHVFILFEAYEGRTIDADNAAKFGDFIGGYIGTIAVLLSLFLVVRTYKNQVSANKINIFEGRFFELMKYYRENVQEIDVGGKDGRRVFVSMIREYRESLSVVKGWNSALGLKYDNLRMIDMAYLIFFYGVGPNSTRLLKSALSGDYDSYFIAAVIARVERIQSEYRSMKTAGSVGSNGLTRLSYCPFDGHQSRLGHYYRHLYQMVKYCERASIIDPVEYVDMIRAQMTNHEQALMCLNSMSKVGRNWMKKGYIEKYQMVKNLPRNFFDPAKEFNLEDVFDINFEYQDQEVVR